MSTYSNFFSFRDTSHACRTYEKLLAIYPFYCFFSRLVLLFPTPSLLRSFFFLPRPHSHSNLFERIIHARVMVEMHSREEKGPRRFTEYDIRSTLFFVTFYSFFSPLFDALRVAHIFCREVRCKSQLYSRYFGDRNWFSNFCTNTCSDAL